MVELWGQEYAPDAVRRLVGTMDQLAGIRLSTLDTGRDRGMRTAELYTGSGFSVQVLIDRALDLGAARYGGRPLAWLYPALGPPALYDPHGNGWLRTFGGGLVTTCGLTHFGQTEVDEGEEFGLHGRISHEPADDVAVITAWQGDDYVLEIRGTARQAVLFGENLVLERRIRSRLGARSVTIHDRVRNEGFRPTSHLILYHCNFGFPVVSPDSELLVADTEVHPRDAAAAAGLAGHTHFDQPQADFAEQVFFHKPRVAPDRAARAAIVNRALGFGAYLRYDAATLPYLAQWKMMGAGEYVCALEPANRWETPRKTLRAESRMPILAPGESVDYTVEIGVLPDAAAIAAFAAALSSGS